MYNVICYCGNKKTLSYALIYHKGVKSCGCSSYSAEHRKTHEMSRSRAYKSWSHMKYRCLNENSISYPNYGGRGIKVCDRWLNSFENFYDDMGDRPNGMSIDRIDIDGDYEPSNCRWATTTTQAINRKGKGDAKVKYKGVMETRDGVYRAVVRLDGKGYHMGYFRDPKHAALAYDEGARLIHGEFAKTNADLGNFDG